MDISYDWMEKAGPHVSRRFDHGRDPRSIAARRHVLGLTQMSTEVLDDATQFASALDDET
jgi:hypothetical protein